MADSFVGQHTDWPACDIHSSSNEYARRFSGRVGEWMLERQLSPIFEWLGRFQIETILDVGGGHGQFAIPAVSEGFDVTVLGSHDESFERVREHPLSGRLNYEVANFYELPFADNSFDAAICLRQVCHVDDWQHLVSELCRVSKHCVVIDYPPIDSLNILYPILFRVKKFIEGNTRPYTVLSSGKVDRSFKNCGYSPLDRRRLFFVPLGLHRMLRCRWLSERLEEFFRVTLLQRFFGSPMLYCAVCTIERIGVEVAFI